MDGRKGKSLNLANQAEILRAHQKDEEFIGRLRDKLLNLLERLKGQNKLYAISLSGISLKLLYLIFTSGLSNQTLGEEYSGLIQINLKNATIPTTFARILGGVLEIFGEHGFVKILEMLKKYINSSKNKNYLQPNALFLFNMIIDKLKLAFPILILLHKSLFYIYGRYYSFGRRLTAIDYVKVYGRRPSDGISWGLKLLGVVTLSQCLLQIYRDLYTENKSIDSNDEFNKSSEMNNLNNDIVKCQLCIESTASTVTPCGHLFCWNCLADWVRLKSQCPFCREQFLPSRIVHLMNL